MKSLYDQLGGTYRRAGECHIPDLALPEQNAFGIWGRRYLHNLKEHHYTLYTVMLLNGTLTAHAADIDRQASERMDFLIRQMARLEGVTEQLKAADSMEWVRQMNGIRARAEEVVRMELINI